MNKRLLFCGIATTLSAFAFVACDKDDDNSNSGADLSTVSASFLNVSECKSGLRSSASAVQDSLIAYDFDMSKGEGTIRVINEMHNCCASFSEAKFSTQGETVVIEIAEDTTYDKCRCLCEFDLTAKVTGVTANKYQFLVNGTYFEVDLAQKASGVVYGAPKEQETQDDEDLRGTFAFASDCKNNLRNSKDQDNSTGKDSLVSYDFNFETGEGTITSINRILNCCPSSLESTTNKTEKGIEINTYEGFSEISCNCICRYDIATKITGFSAKEYHFIVDGIEFDIDLSKETKGVIMGNASDRD